MLKSLKIQLKVIIILNTMVDGICLLILLSLNVIPSSQPARFSCIPTHALSLSLALACDPQQVN